MGRGPVASKQNPTAPTFRRELLACSESGLGGALRPRKATGNLLKQLSTTLSRSKPSTRASFPKNETSGGWGSADAASPGAELGCANAHRDGKVPLRLQHSPVAEELRFPGALSARSPLPPRRVRAPTVIPGPSPPPPQPIVAFTVKTEPRGQRQTAPGGKGYRCAPRSLLGEPTSAERAPGPGGDSLTNDMPCQRWQLLCLGGAERFRSIFLL